MPTIVLVKYPGAPVGEAGLQSILNSRTKSDAVTWRGGDVSHLTPFLRWSVYVLPPAVMPPFAIVGTEVAISGTTLISSRKLFDERNVTSCRVKARATLVSTV